MIEAQMKMAAKGNEEILRRASDRRALQLGEAQIRPAGLIFEWVEHVPTIIAASARERERMFRFTRALTEPLHRKSFFCVLLFWCFCVVVVGCCGMFGCFCVGCVVFVRLLLVVAWGRGGCMLLRFIWVVGVVVGGVGCFLVLCKCWLVW